MTELQQRVVDLLDSATPGEQLEEWKIGKIPKHYKRLSVSMDEAIELAKIGFEEAFVYFGNRLYFTQALIIGAIISGRYTDIVAVTPSQYGKSWDLGQLGILRANEGYNVYVAGDSSNTTEIIMGKVMEHLQTVHSDVKSKLLEPTDKIERLQTSLSKKSVGFRPKGLIKGISLGETFNSQLKGNNAIGLGGDYLIDEASRIQDDTYAELGRRQFASEDGKEFASVRISNPHNAGRFWDDLTADEVPPKTLIIWMDARTALEEGRIKSKEQVINSEFFKNKSTCKRYLLCELEDYSEDSLFTEPVIDDSEEQHPMPNYEYFLGVDSAYKGKDDIKVTLSALTETGKVKVIECVTINKEQWIDGMTSKKVINDISIIAIEYGIKMICVDVGYGVWLIEGLIEPLNQIGCKVLGVNFGSGATKTRKDAKHFAATNADNKRAEMHLDLQSLMDNQSISFTEQVAECIKDELSATKGIRKPNGKTAIIPKDEIKQTIGHSPDSLDSVILSLHALLIYQISGKMWMYQDN